jgi:predicted transcriptional regulator
MKSISIRSKELEAEPSKQQETELEPKEELDFSSKSIDLEGDEDIAIAVTFKMSKTLYKQIGQIALDKEVSRASIIRQAIKEHLKNLEHPEYEEFYSLFSDTLKQMEEEITIAPETTMEEVLSFLKEQLEQRKKEKE